MKTARALKQRQTTAIDRIRYSSTVSGFSQWIEMRYLCLIKWNWTTESEYVEMAELRHLFKAKSLISTPKEHAICASDWISMFVQGEKIKKTRTEFNPKNHVQRINPI